MPDISLLFDYAFAMAITLTLMRLLFFDTIISFRYYRFLRHC